MTTIDRNSPLGRVLEMIRGLEASRGIKLSPPEWQVWFDLVRHPGVTEALRYDPHYATIDRGL